MHNTLIPPSRPRNRGLFSDRQVWDDIHRDRFTRYAEGEDVTEIAAVHQVRREAIHRSIRRCLTRMPSAEAKALREQRRHRRNDWKQMDAALTEMERLFGFIE